MPAQAAIQQAPGDPDNGAHDVGDPVIDVCAAIKCRLYQFNGAAERTRANEDRQQAKAARAGQGEGECGEGNEVDNFVATRRRWRRLVQGPEHRDRERKKDDECQGNVEVLAHGAGVRALNFEGKRRLIWGAQHLNGNAPRIRGLGVPIRARFREID